MLREFKAKSLKIFCTHGYCVNVLYPFVVITMPFTLLIMSGCYQDQANQYPTTKTMVGIASPKVIQAANLPQTCNDSLAASIEIDGNGSFSMEKRDDGLFYYYTKELSSGSYRLMIEFSCDMPNSTMPVSLATASKIVSITDGPDTIQLANSDFSIFPDDDTDGISNLLELKNGTNPRHFIQRISVDSEGNEATGGSSATSSVSADGRYVAFVSSATNLVFDDSNSITDVFIHDTKTQTTIRVNVDSTGNEAIAGPIGGSSEYPKFSADGRYVVFSSSATNLVAGDSNVISDIFMHDTQTKTTIRVSVNSAGNEATGFSNFGSYSPSISADGRVVVFWSAATNLVAGDSNGINDIFMHDTQINTTIRVSVDSGGNQAILRHSFSPSISAEGRYVAFHSSAPNLVAGDSNGTTDIFIRDAQTNTTTRVSVDSTGEEAVDGASLNPSISTDGRYVAFNSDATNLVAGDTNGVDDVFMHDTQTNTTIRVSVDSASNEAIGGGSYYPNISADGRYVAFSSDAINLVAGDSNGVRDIFIHDTLTKTTIRVSVDSAGNEVAASSGSTSPSISANGRVVVFSSSASTLVAGDNNNSRDIFRVVLSSP